MSSENPHDTTTSTHPNLWHIKARVPYVALHESLITFEQLSLLGMSWAECDDSAPLELLDDSGFPIASEFIIDGYTYNPPSLNAITAALSCVIDICLKQLGNQDTFTPQVAIQLVDDKDWLEACYKTMSPRIFGRYYVYGSHLIDERVPDNLFGVCIDAATAFGSGEHPSTRGCLEALTILSLDIPISAPLEKESGVNFLDMGCGSGILGIAAKQTFPLANVYMADCDPESVRVATLNASLNGVSITVEQSLGFENPLIEKAGPYLLVFANILAQPLCDLAPHFSASTSKGGYVIVSGLLSRHKEMVCDVYQQAGFTLFETIDIEDWQTLIFQK